MLFEVKRLTTKNINRIKHDNYNELCYQIDFWSWDYLIVFHSWNYTKKGMDIVARVLKIWLKKFVKQSKILFWDKIRENHKISLTFKRFEVKNKNINWKWSFPKSIKYELVQHQNSYSELLLNLTDMQEKLHNWHLTLAWKGKIKKKIQLKIKNAILELIFFIMLFKQLIVASLTFYNYHFIL